MPFILHNDVSVFNTSRSVGYNMSHPAPYWMPQDSLGTCVYETSPALYRWFEESEHDLSPSNCLRLILRNPIHTNDVLGLRGDDYCMTLSVFMPRINRLMCERRMSNGRVLTEIYRTTQAHYGLEWVSEFTFSWDFDAPPQTTLEFLEQYDTTYQLTAGLDHLYTHVPFSLPACETFLFAHGSQRIISSTNQPQEETMQHSEPVAPAAPAAPVESPFRHPLPHEFNTRIEQGDRKLDKLKHAVMVLAAHRVCLRVGDIPTGRYPQSEIDAATAMLSKFFNAVAVAVPRLLNNTHQRERLFDTIKALQNDARVRGSNTNYSALRHEYRDLYELATKTRNAAMEVIHDYMALVADISGYGELSMTYALEKGALQSTSMLRASTINARICRILDNSGEDHDLVVDLLNEHGFVQCTDCSDWESEDNTRRPYGSDYDNVCRHCIDNNYTYSSYYDEYIHCDDGRNALDSDGDEVYVHCDDDDFHYNERLGMHCHVNYSGTLIASYHSTQRSGFKFIRSDWVKRNDRFLGIELEIECRDNKYDAVTRLNDALNDGDVGKMVWFENDGSLSSSGFEMITNPMGLDTHIDFWEWLQDKNLTRTLRSHDTSTCGLHIHVSRNNLHDLQLNRMNVFINHPDNQMLIKAVARRYATNYARIREKQMGKAHYAVDRYDALNLENEDTVEFRIFKGTLKYESLMAAIEFANAVVNFTNPASPAGFNLSTDRFIRFISHDSQRSETRHLRSYLKDAGFTV